MKNRIFVLFGFSIVILLIFVLAFMFDPGLSEIPKIEGISMVMEKETLKATGGTILITDVTGKDNSYSSDYRIDKKEKGKWKTVRNIESTKIMHISDSYRELNENHTLELDHYWGAKYGQLKTGTYRIVKWVNTQNENDEFMNIPIAAEFTIE